MIIGTVNNSATIEIAFDFFTGVAGVRDLGDGRLQCAFATIRLSSIRGEGTIDGDPYVVEGSATPSATLGLVTMIVRPIGGPLA